MLKYFIISILLTTQVYANLRVDYSILKDQNNEEFIYLSYTYYADNFEILTVDQAYEVSTKASFNLTSRFDTIRFESDLTNRFNEDPKNRIVIGVESIKIKNTSYKLDLIVQDQYSDKTLKKSIKIKQVDLSNDYSISEPILAYNIIQKDKANYGLNLLIDDNYVLPNPSRSIEGSNLDLNLYTKFYNNSLNIEKISTTIDIINSKDIVVKRDTINNSNNVIMFRMKINDQATGVYRAKITLIDYENRNELSNYTSSRFYLINPNKGPEQTPTFTENQEFDMSEYSTMPLETVSREYRKMRFILSKYEIEQYEKLDLLKAKQRALFTYWKYRDPDTTTFINERKVDFDKAVKYANTYYKFSNIKEGWSTDRGRVLLQYGFPTETDKFEEKEDLNACEIWYYGQIRGGVYFYFVDTGNFNDYRLVHSTMLNEIYDRDWRERYNPAIDQTDFLERKSTLDDQRDF